MRGTKFVLVLMIVISLVVTPPFQGSNHAEASSSKFKIAVLPDTKTIQRDIQRFLKLKHNGLPTTGKNKISNMLST